MKEDLNLHTNHPESLFKFIYRKAQDLCKIFSSFSHNFISNSKTDNFCIFVICNYQSFISQISKVAGPLGEKFEVLSPLGFQIQRNFDLETTKVKFHSVGALKRYPNEKNLKHSRETATI